MIPFLYEANETVFSSNGLGPLNDAILCEATEELNGQYELYMEYPITGIHADDLKNERIILAKPNEISNPQPFRIYEVTKTLDGNIEALANHISYDLAGYPIRKVTAATAAAAVAALASRAIIAPPFTFSTDLSVSKAFGTEAPASMRQPQL